MSERILKRGSSFSIGNGLELIPVLGCEVLAISPALHKMDEWVISARGAQLDARSVDVIITRAELQALADWAHTVLDRQRIAEIALAVVKANADRTDTQEPFNRSIGSGNTHAL